MAVVGLSWKRGPFVYYLKTTTFAQQFPNKHGRSPASKGWAQTGWLVFILSYYADQPPVSILLFILVSPSSNINHKMSSSAVLLALFSLLAGPCLLALAKPNPAPAPLFGIGIGRTQSAGVEGILTCEGEPAANVLVKLYDDDRGVDTDDLMAEGRTDEEGHFKLEGHTQEITDIDPKLNVYHDCADNKPCQRKISIMIPDKYISSGQKASTFYNMGTVELEGKFKGEERDCIH